MSKEDVGYFIHNITINWRKSVLGILDVSDLVLEAEKTLSPTDWYVTRSTERSKAIPSDVSTYRAAVISTLNTIETKIKAAATLSVFKALYENEYYAANDALKSKSVIHTWPDSLED